MKDTNGEKLTTVMPMVVKTQHHQTPSSISILTERPHCGRNFLHSARLMLVTLHEYLKAADGEQDVLLGDLEARGEHGFEVRLVTVLPETGHLAGAGHLDPEHHVSSGQAGKGKLRNLECMGHMVRNCNDK